MSCYRNLNGQIFLPVFIFYILFASFSSAASTYSIYLVRHAEKIDNSKDSALTRCGKFRAKQLASLLSKTNITQVYSTHYKGTMQTARALSNQQQIAIKTYNSNYLAQVSLQLQQQKKNTLVVGSSETIPRLISLLTQKAVTSISEQDYQLLYQLQFIDKKILLTILQQPLSCKNS